MFLLDMVTKNKILSQSVRDEFEFEFEMRNSPDSLSAYQSSLCSRLAQVGSQHKPDSKFKMAQYKHHQTSSVN